MFKVNGVNNVLVSGGTAYGDRYTHDYSVPSDPSKKTHEWNHCFQVYGSEKITIRDFCGIGFAGDGLSMASKDVSDSSAEEPVDDVLLDNVAFIDCRRQGISIGKATNVVVQYSTCAKTNGTSPECGIDIEPESGGTTRNIHIYRCSLMDNAKNGVEILRRSGVTTPLQEVYVVECNLSENVMGAQTTSVEGVAFYSNIVRHNSATGIRINAGTTGLNITGCTFGQNYDQGGNGSSRTPFNRTGWDKSLEKDILPYNDMAQNFFGVNYYQ
jgi:hypothetical protein